MNTFELEVYLFGTTHFVRVQAIETEEELNNNHEKMKSYVLEALSKMMILQESNGKFAEQV